MSSKTLSSSQFARLRLDGSKRRAQRAEPYAALQGGSAPKKQADPQHGKLSFLGSREFERTISRVRRVRKDAGSTTTVAGVKEVLDEARIGYLKWFTGNSKALDKKFEEIGIKIRKTFNKAKKTISTSDELSDEVEAVAVKSVRLMRLPETDEICGVEYLVQWEDDCEDSWEPAQNIAENLLKDYEDQWWTAVKESNEFQICEMLTGCEEVLAGARDADGRTALHFACGVGNPKIVQLLLDFGAGVSVNRGDKDGYTPLHIAAGYLHSNVVTLLTRYGADPEMQDKNGRSVLDLVNTLKKQIPKGNTQFFSRRLSLEEVIREVNKAVYQMDVPDQILERRERDEYTTMANGQMGAIKKVEYKVRWFDGAEIEEESMVEAPVEEEKKEDAQNSEEEEEEEEEVWVKPLEEWVDEDDLSPDLIADFMAGLEYADAVRVLDTRTTSSMYRKDQREFLVEWADESEATWEPEANVTADLIAAFEAEGPTSDDSANSAGASAHEHAAVSHAMDHTNGASLSSVSDAADLKKDVVSGGNDNEPAALQR